MRYKNVTIIVANTDISLEKHETKVATLKVVFSRYEHTNT